jgi:hypothetical protein
VSNRVEGDGSTLPPLLRRVTGHVERLVGGVRQTPVQQVADMQLDIELAAKVLDGLAKNLAEALEAMGYEREGPIGGGFGMTVFTVSKPSEQKGGPDDQHPPG